MSGTTQQPEITWTVSMDKANMILSIIAKQPFEVVADLIVELRNQAQSQLQMQQATQSGNGALRESIQ